MTSPKQSLNHLSDAENLVALVGVEFFDSHLFAVLAFFEKGIEKSEIILRDEKTSYRVFLPPEALGLRGLSRVFNLELNYASIQQTAD
jgi:hypothetical protein